MNVTPAVLKQIERKKEKEKIAADKLKQEALDFQTALSTIGRFTIKKQVGEDGVLFGTVTNGDVAEAIEALVASGHDDVEGRLTYERCAVLGRTRYALLAVQNAFDWDKLTWFLALPLLVQALLISIFPPQKRATALGIWSMTTLVAPIMGPILGGYISDNFHWSWIFLINVPFGVLTAIVCWTNLTARETPTMKLPIDTVGLALLVIWVGSMQVMLDLGKNADWFNDPVIVVLTVTAAVAFVAWVIWELTDANPTVDLTLFARRNFWIGNLAFALGYAVFFANTLILPLWLQTQLAYTATWAGLVAAPSGLVAVILTPIVARISGKIDARILATVAFLGFAISYWLRSGYTTQASFTDLMLPLLVQGVSMSTFFVAMLTISLDKIPPERLPSATGISNFCRITAGSFAASIITTAWDRREALHQSRLAEAIGTGVPYRMAADQMQRLGLNATQAAGAVTRQMVGQAYLLASTDLFRLSAWLAGGLTVLVWLVRRPAAHDGPVAAD